MLFIFTYKQLNKIVVEPKHEKFTIHVENEHVFSMWNGFRFVDYDKEYSYKRDIEEVLNIFDNSDNYKYQICNIRYIFRSYRKEQHTELFQHMARLVQQPQKSLPRLVMERISCLKHY